MVNKQETETHDSIDLVSLMKKSTLLIVAIIVLLISISKIFNAPTAAVETVEAAQEHETTQVEPEAPQEAPVEVIDPQGCEPEQYWAAEPPHNCIDKPKVVARQSVPQGTGDCFAEARKYDWNLDVAFAVIRGESGGNTNALNNNPATGDYSVGCFQINLYGANARTRPSEAQLRIASVNVAFAYQIYVGNGRSFLGQWGACRHIYCY